MAAQKGRLVEGKYAINVFRWHFDQVAISLASFDHALAWLTSGSSVEGKYAINVFRWHFDQVAISLASFDHALAWLTSGSSLRLG